MSVASQDVYLNLNTPVSVIGSGGGGSVPANLVVSTLSAFGLTNISSINGTAYTGSAGVPANLVVSTISTSGGASFPGTIHAGSRISLVSTNIESNSGGSGTNLTIDSVFGAMRLQAVSTLMTGAGVNACQVTMDGNLNVSSINGAAVGAAAIPANLVVSTLTAATNVSIVGNYGLTALQVAGASGTPEFSTLVVNGGLDLVLRSGLGSTIMTRVNGDPSQVAIPGNLFVSSINGTSWNYITSTLLGLSP
jgi:hypothetical protein